jgi:hypothetical protein
MRRVKIEGHNWERERDRQRQTRREEVEEEEEEINKYIYIYIYKMYVYGKLLTHIQTNLPISKLKTKKSINQKMKKKIIFFPGVVVQSRHYLCQFILLLYLLGLYAPWKESIYPFIFFILLFSLSVGMIWVYDWLV